MRAVALVAVISAGTQVTASEPLPRAELAPACIVWWDWSERYSHGILCVDDADSSVPPTTIPQPEPNGAIEGSMASGLESGNQQKSRRLPGGFLDLDVKKRD